MVEDCLMVRDAVKRKAASANAKRPNAKWRSKPASEAQLAELRLIAERTGQPFRSDLTRGEASAVLTATYGPSRW